MKAFLILIVTVVVLVGVGLAIANFGLGKTQTESHTISGTVREIVVKAGAGDVTFVPGSDRVEVRETRRYVFSEPEVERELRGGVLTLETDCDATRVVLRCHADLRIAVPPRTRLVVETDSGDIDARAVDARYVNVRSDSGDIRLGLIGTQTLVWAHADTGDVDVVTADARAIDALTDSGEVRVDAAGGLRKVVARSDRGDVNVVVPRGIYTISTASESGDVAVRGVLRNRSAQRAIEAETDSGDITLSRR
ncbi:MAG: DUF4097 family beta strand repeat-containing protein [Solirubrobacteraceae bacterium]|nr:DUF4097 family beta strand repeat-containing protein [Solirubrobacteraceae bacterium]